MNKTLDLTQQKAEIRDKIEVVVKAAEKREKPGLTAEERVSVDQMFEEISGIDATISANARLNALGANGGSARPIIQYVHEFSLEKPFGYDAFPRLWDNKANETKEEKQFRIHYGFGEQLLAIRNAEMSQKNPMFKTDERLHQLNDWYQKRSTPSGMSEQVPADGGFLIYPDFSAEVYRLAHETGAVYTMGNKIPISDQTNAIKIPAVDQTSRADGSRWGGVRAYWMNEADALTPTKPKFRLLELVTKKLGVLYYATDEVVADAAALGAIITQAFGEEFGFKMDDASVNGDGAGKPQGILNSPALIAVAKESGQATLTVVWQNILKMWFRLWIKSRRNAVWFINQDVESQLIQMMTNTTYGVSVVAGVAPDQGAFSTVAPIYTPVGYMQQPTARLMGRPVIPIEQCASLTSQGDIILADMSQWIYIDKGSPVTAASMHVRFLNDEMTYRAIYRVDGQGWWHTPLTPFNGTNTVSPFITLAAR